MDVDINESVIVVFMMELQGDILELQKFNL